MKRRAIALAALLLAGAACTEQKPPPPPAAPVKGDFELLLEKGQRDPGDAATWYHIADLYERSQQYGREVDALGKVLAAKPDMGYASFKLANAYNRLGKREEAIAAFLRADKTWPNSPVLFNNLGWTYGQVGRTKDQVAALRRAVQLRPRYATARRNLAVVLLKQGDRAGAEEQYRAIKEFDEDTAAELRHVIETGKERP
jgi:tetratricopeptide (TPR) repeat protein